MNVGNVVPMTHPPPPPRTRTEPHLPVLCREVVEALAPKEGSVIVDATLGAGGHTKALLEAAPGARVIGVDRDERALEIAKKTLAGFGDRVTFVHGAFSAIERHLEALGAPRVDGLLADVGVSSMQIDEPSRGMSFRFEGPLDMRMDTSSGETALDLIDALSDDELADVIYRFGEERRSRRVARCIKQARANGELETTLDLRRAVVRAVGPARVGGVDPATRTFQALRVAVNAELDELGALLGAAERVIGIGGTIAIITFHSLEDRIVKRGLRGSPAWRPLTKKPVIPGDEETAENPRARSAKLRAARRVDPSAPVNERAGRYSDESDDDEEETGE
jgi:16S rRNA (cytosine1402-N4)-methyltransferase